MFDRRRLAAVAALLAFLAATNRWLSWNGAFALLLPHDETDYAAIARAVPGLPAGHAIQLQHGERFAFHWLIGVVARVLQLGAEHAYAIAAPLAVVAVCVVLWAVLASVGIGIRGFAICTAALVLNAYSFRYYVLAPGYVADLLFDLGTLVTVLGLVARRYPVLLAGVVVAALARQTELPVSVAVAAAVAFAEPWRSRHGRGGRLALAAAPVVLAVVIYLVEEHVARGFTYDPTPDLAHMTVLAELEALPHGAGTLGQHLLRSVNGLLAVAALLVVALVALRERIRALPVEFWGPLAIGLLIAVQPLVFSAQYAAKNETRLAVLGLGPLVCALAVLLSELERRGRELRGWALAAVLAVLAVDSLHHIYTVVGTSSARQTVALQIVCAAALLVIVWRALLRGGSRAVLRGDGRPSCARPPAD